MRRGRATRPNPLSLISFQDIITAVSGVMLLVTLLLVLQVLTAKAEPADAPRPAEEIRQRIEQALRERDELQEQLQALRQEVQESGPVDVENASRALEDAERELTALERRLQEAAEQVDEAVSRAAEHERSLREAKRETARLERQATVLEEEARGAEDAIVTHFVFADRGEKTPVLVECSGDGIKVEVRDGASQPISFIDPARVSVQRSIDEFRDWLRRRDPERKAFMVLVKPSAAGYAAEVVGMIREKGFDVGYEPLEENRVGVVLGEEGP